VEKYGRDRRATDDDVIERMRIASWITKTRLQTHTHTHTHIHITKYSLLFHATVVNANAPQSYMDAACLANLLLMHEVKVVF